MKRLKILFITSWYPTEENPVNGVFVREHAKAVSLYNDVVILHLDGYSQKVKGLYGFQEKEIEGLPTIRLNYRRFPIPFIKQCAYFNYICTAILGFRKIVKSGFKPDIIHANMHTCGVPAVIIGTIFKIPVVISEHYSGFPRKLLSCWEIKKAKFAFERARYILPVSKSLQKAIESYRIKAKFDVLPNVVDTNIFYHDSTVEKKVEIKQILLVALLTPIKGLEYLLPAIKELKNKRQDFLLNIIGDGPNREEFEQLANDLSISDKVIFHGIKTKGEIANFMRKSNFFILPSLWENLPCVLLEAMACGLPIIASNVGGIPEIITNEIGILTEPKNIASLVSAINKMLDECQRYQSAKIADYAVKDFSYHPVALRINTIYQKSINMN